MKTRSVLVFVFLFATAIMYCQKEETKVKVYVAWVKTMKGDKSKGFLLDADSSSVLLINKLED